MSVWHKAFEKTFKRTSPLFGGCTSISVMSKGLLASQATAALHFIGLPEVLENELIKLLYIEGNSLINSFYKVNLYRSREAESLVID